MIGLDDEVGASEVPPDDRVPQGLARSGSPRRERQQRQGRKLPGVVAQNLLVALDAREMAQVAMHGDADGGVQKQMPSHLPGRMECQLAFALVHRAVRMERDDPSPTQSVEEPVELPRRMAQLLVVVVRRKLDAENAATHVDVPDPLVEVPYTGVAVRMWFRTPAALRHACPVPRRR